LKALAIVPAVIVSVACLCLMYRLLQPQAASLESAALQQEVTALRELQIEVAATLQQQLKLLQNGREAGQAATIHSRPSSLPAACLPFVAQYDEHGTLAAKSTLAHGGGSWTVTDHLCAYGFNWPEPLGRFLTFQLKPKRVLEFGCGLGLTADYLARFGRNTEVTCIEPQAMLPEVFATSGNKQLHHLMVDASKPRNTPDFDCIQELQATDFDLVLSLEVLEHVPEHAHTAVLDLLANATTKFLVFAAARVGQAGHGHISPRSRRHYILEFKKRGLRYLPRMTKTAQSTTYIHRNYDLFGNMVVFAAMGANDIRDTDAIHPVVLAQLGDDSDFVMYHKMPQELARYPEIGEHWFPGADDDQRKAHAAVMFRWMWDSTLWPQTSQMMRTKDVCSRWKKAPREPDVLANTSLADSAIEQSLLAQASRQLNAEKQMIDRARTNKAVCSSFKIMTDCCDGRDEREQYQHGPNCVPIKGAKEFLCEPEAFLDVVPEDRWRDAASCGDKRLDSKEVRIKALAMDNYQLLGSETQ